MKTALLRILPNWIRDKRIAILVVCVVASIGAASSCKTKDITAYEVPPEALAPRLLLDQEDMKNYLAAFPADKYAKYNVKGLGEFYIDNPTDVIKSFIVKGQVWEANINKVLEKYIERGSTVLDVGAHIGTHTIPMARSTGPKGKVYAFEPQKKLFRELYYNLKLNHLSNAIPLRYALGNNTSVIEMAVPPQGNEGATAIGTGGDKTELRTIDSFGFQGVSVIKIDVEGFEDQVIEGARETILRSHPVLVVEIVGWAEYDSAPPETKLRIDNSKKKIEELGYTVRLLRKADYLALPRH